VPRAGPPGAPVSPNLAGRLAAAFALGDQVFRATDAAFADRCLASAESVFAAAQTGTVNDLLTTGPHEYYGETEWWDDMEWGATELFNATHKKSYLEMAAIWAQAYQTQGGDTLNLYDVGSLAHFELARAMNGNDVQQVGAARQSLIDALKKRLDQAAARSAKDPFGLGLPYNTGDLTPHVIGLALEASFYDELTKTTTFRDLAAAQRHWVLGNNAWGVSFIVAAGSVYPKHLHHQIANLTGIELSGAVLDGPGSEREVARSMKELPDGARRSADEKRDEYRIFSGNHVRFADNVACYLCVEPALDYAALSPLLFSRDP
jgi:endoglucanase